MIKKTISMIKDTVVLPLLTTSSFPSPASIVADGQIRFSSANSSYTGTYPSLMNRYNTAVMFPAGRDAKRSDNNLNILLPFIVFRADSGTLDNLNAETIANNEWILSHIAAIINTYGDYKILLEGHANPTVDPRDTRRRLLEQRRKLKPLSELRAKTIANELMKLGVESNRIEFYGIGGEHPVASWEDYNNWWKNRRVEFILEGK